MSSKSRPGTYGDIQWWIKLFGMRWGYMRETIGRKECPYLHRKVLFCGPLSFRYHVFLGSDDDRALHDHPWAFITFPFQKYLEQYYREGANVKLFRYVLPWGFHYRKLGFRHRVIVDHPPVRTLVITGPVAHKWGFWVDGLHVRWRKYHDEFGTPACVGPDGQEE